MTESEQNQWLARAEAGDEAARQQLFTLLYDQLHRLAKSALHRSGAQLRLSATTLLHEAYLDISSRTSLRFGTQAQFMAYASRAMRGLIIDYAREAKAQKRGFGFAITSLPTALQGTDRLRHDLERLDEALEQLAAEEVALAELVDLKFFCGFSFVQIAAMRNVSERTVQRDWNKARLYLHAALFD